MHIEFTCPSCNTTLRVPDAHAGKNAKCPHCDSIVLVEAGTQSPQPPFKQADAGQPNFGQPNFGQPNAGAGNPYASQSTAPGYGAGMGSQSGYVNPHRGGLILTMGILALVMNFMAIPGILAWIMGRSDLKQMDQGLMDNEGRGLTTAGMIMGIIGTCFMILFFLLFLAYIAFVFFIVIAAGAGAR